MTDYDRRIADLLGLQPQHVAATIQLLDEGNTQPFIARYRKELTGGMADETIRQLADLLGRLRAVDERRAAILRSIEEQGRLTPELRGLLEAAETLADLEDLYQPYRPKRRTRASIARVRGLQGLADLILAQARVEQSAEALAAAYLSEAVPTAAEALSGARDIVAEVISDHAAVRGTLRGKAVQWAVLRAEK